MRYSKYVQGHILYIKVKFNCYKYKIIKNNILFYGTYFCNLDDPMNT